MLTLKKKPIEHRDTRIILIRHANKLKSKNPGVALNANGEVLAMKFAYYFIEAYGYPDVIYAPKASSKSDKPQSLRSQQTVAPLMTLMAEQGEIPVFNHNEYPRSYNNIVKEIKKKHQDKLILICWGHKRINNIANALGIDQKLPLWDKEDYNSVYEITFVENTPSLRILRDQYTINFNGSFKDILTALEGHSYPFEQKTELTTSLESFTTTESLTQQFKMSMKLTQTNEVDNESKEHSNLKVHSN